MDGYVCGQILVTPESKGRHWEWWEKEKEKEVKILAIAEYEEKINLY